MDSRITIVVYNIMCMIHVRADGKEKSIVRVAMERSLCELNKVGWEDAFAAIELSCPPIICTVALLSNRDHVALAE